MNGFAPKFPGLLADESDEFNDVSRAFERANTGKPIS